MKFLSALSVDPTKLPWVESGTSGSTSESVDNLNDKIISTVFKKLNSFICPKLQTLPYSNIEVRPGIEDL